MTATHDATNATSPDLDPREGRMVGPSDRRRGSELTPGMAALPGLLTEVGDHSSGF